LLFDRYLFQTLVAMELHNLYTNRRVQDKAPIMNNLLPPHARALRCDAVRTMYNIGKRIVLNFLEERNYDLRMFGDTSVFF